MMTTTATAFLSAFVAAVLVFAWIFRLDTPVRMDTYSVVVTDRWTGKVYSCHVISDECNLVYPLPLEAPKGRM
jgi:hypothetical protein